MLGLNDRFLTTHPPEDLGETLYLGHELGDGAYVLRRKPDLVLFCVPQGGAKPCFRSGREMVALPDFRKQYQLVAFEGEKPHLFRSLIWVRRDSNKIGIQRTPDRLIIPGFLLGDSSTTLSRLNAVGKVVAEIPPRTTMMLEDLPIEAGRWSIVADVDDGILQARLRRTAGPESESSTFDVNIEVPSGSTVEVEIRNPADTAAHLSDIVVARR
jgi:hypothetical protein